MRAIAGRWRERLRMLLLVAEPHEGTALLVAAIAGITLALHSPVAGLLGMAATGINTSFLRTSTPSAVNLSGVAAAEGSSLSSARADHTHSISGSVPQANGGTGAGALTCTNQFLTSNGTAYSCVTDTLASAQHANQGTTTQLIHGNGAGNPTWGAVVQADVTNGYVDLSTAQASIGGAKTFTSTATDSVTGSAWVANGNAAGDAELYDNTTGPFVILGRNGTTKYAQVFFGDATTLGGGSGQWDIGLRSGDSDLHFYTAANSAEGMILVQGATPALKIPGLAAAGVITNTSAGLLGTLAGTTTTTLHGNAAGLPTYASVAGTDFATQTANKIFAGPTSGGAASPTFRALVAADIAGTTASAGAWMAEDIGTAVNGGVFTGVYKSAANTPKFRTIACSWQVAGTLGTTGFVVHVQNLTDASTLCACTLGACTTAANTALSCDCNTASLAGKAYTLVVDATSDCTTYPQNTICNVEMQQ